MNNLVKYFLIAILTLFILDGKAQERVVKPSLSINDFENWPELNSERGISVDGHFVYYTVNNEVGDTSILHLQAVDNSWKIAIDAANSAAFASKHKLFIAITAKSDLLIFDLNTKNADTLRNVSEASFIISDNIEYLVYKKNETNEILFQNLSNKSIQSYTRCERFYQSPDKKNIVIISSSDDFSKAAFLLNLKAKSMIKFWEGTNFENLFFDCNANKICFFIKRDTIHKESKDEVWQYNYKTNTKLKLIDNTFLENRRSVEIKSFEGLAANGESIILKFIDKPVIESKSKIRSSVDVYNYKDRPPYGIQLSRASMSEPQELFAIYNIKRQQVVYIQQPGEEFFLMLNEKKNIAFVGQGAVLGYNTDSVINFLISTSKPEKIRIKFRPSSINAVSQDGNYVILTGNDNLYLYDVKSDKTCPLTQNLPILPDSNFSGEGDKRALRLLAWLGDGKQILVQANYDIWKIDLLTHNTFNVTNGLGQKNRILFNLSELNGFQQSGYEVATIPNSDLKKDITLTTYDYGKGDNDYYSINLKSKRNPVRLTQGGFLYEHSNIVGGWLHAFDGRNHKAGNANVFMLDRQNAATSSNIVVTSDFKNFIQVSKNYPERRFNWLSTEMIHFRATDGRRVSGVLYKPENFDSAKKYPVILLFYSIMSPDLNRYRVPELSAAVIDIPYYTSNGYLVCTPDIDVVYGKGIAGRQALNSVLGVTNYLSKLEYVDSTKFGIIGHSWGGFVSNYIVTHSNRFAAAVTASGTSDPIGNYGLTDHGGIPNFNISYDNVEGSIYSNLNGYIKNSPKLMADKVNTPLLLMHNKSDDAVPFENGLSFFYSLWKLKKTVWLLQYDGEGHIILNSNNQLDYTKRLKQFFDHYLKNTPLPKWMAEGIPAKLKGIDDGFALEQ